MTLLEFMSKNPGLTAGIVTGLFLVVFAIIGCTHEQLMSRNKPKE